MNCPEHLMLDAKWLMIWHHQSADIRREYVSWAEVLNPLRYEICIGQGPGRYWHINDDAVAWHLLRNAIWRVKTLCWLRGHDWRELNSFQKPTMICNRCMKTRPAEY
ncbi:hypothetical protein [uncultured Roseobacter sp.]|uniref:hypothetical protein n=1 Tax=uncultured Roseobacter sp. TaxID=114847 RepID=UPI002628C8E7|nr:hypothetical protein [uncultured Roseobacter sp.]